MPNLDYYLQIFSNPLSSNDEKQKLTAGFSELLFKHAMTAIQKHAAIYGLSENDSIKYKDERIVDGFMQEYCDLEKTTNRQASNIFRVNLNVNAYFNGDTATEAAKVKLGYYQDLLESKKQFDESAYQGFALVCLGKCDTMEIVNPYSNPNFYGMELVKNLWSTTIDDIPFICAPIINNTVYIELIKKYYQPEIYRFASNSKNDFADEFTPPYFRNARRTLLRFEALKLYEKLAVEVSELFLPEIRERVRIRIFYYTVFMYFKLAIDNLLNWTQQLTNDAAPDPGRIIQHKELLQQIAVSVTNCISTVYDYINNLDTNPGWRFEQIGSRLSEQKPRNLPLAETDKQLLIENVALGVKNIHLKLRQAQELFNKYVGKKDTVAGGNRLTLPVLPQLKDSGRIWMTIIRLDEFKDALEDALKDKIIRDNILKAVNNTFVSKDGKQHLQILSDEQLVKIYSYVLKIMQDEATRKELLDLSKEAPDGLSAYSYFITRKTREGYIRDPLLERTVSISIAENKFMLDLHPNRKTSDAKELLPKFKGQRASVTPQFDISPYYSELYPLYASKSVDLCRASDDGELDTGIELLKQSVSIARKMGHFVVQGKIAYVHYKLRGGYRVASRITEQWAIATLDKLSKDDDFFKNDIDYRDAKNNNDAAETSRVKSIITLRLIGDLLRDLLKLHNEIKVVHNDVKPQNILIYIDANNKMRARIADFDHSKYMEKIQKSRCQPVATATYASPQVVGFTLITNQQLIHQDLYGDLKMRTNDGRHLHACFGRELINTAWPEILNKAEYMTMKPDYKDDIFSLGVTLFIFITGHYPTNTNAKGKTTAGFDYMQTQQAYSRFPQFKELLEGLFIIDREKRFNATDALNAYNRIAPPVCGSSESKPQTLKAL